MEENYKQEGTREKDFDVHLHETDRLDAASKELIVRLKSERNRIGKMADRVAGAVPPKETDLDDSKNPDPVTQDSVIDKLHCSRSIRESQLKTIDMILNDIEHDIGRIERVF